MTTVGFVGLGAMGLPMARNLVAKQFRVQGFDMRGEALEEAIARYGAPEIFNTDQGSQPGFNWSSQHGFELARVARH